MDYETVKAIADDFEARGYTAPDKHDMTTLAAVKDMLRTLPEKHNLGLVQVLVGNDNYSGATLLLKFLRKCARRSKFTLIVLAGPRHVKANGGYGMQ